VVTADADGQHSAADILRVAAELTANPRDLVLGVRTFGRSVPLRSRLGNALTRAIMRAITGQKPRTRKPACAAFRWSGSRSF